MRLLTNYVKPYLLLATIVTIVSMLSIGCSKKQEIVGTWENTAVQELLEFKADKTGMIQGKNLPPLTFAWKEIDKGSYLLDVNFQGQKKSLKAALQDKALSLEGEGGKETYRKVPTK